MTVTAPVTLQSGQTTSLNDLDYTAKKLRIDLSWEIPGLDKAAFSVDFSCFLLDKNDLFYLL
jgi:stress response protein SCP2